MTRPGNLDAAPVEGRLLKPSDLQLHRQPAITAAGELEERVALRNRLRDQDKEWDLRYLILLMALSVAQALRVPPRVRLIVLG